MEYLLFLKYRLVFLKGQFLQNTGQLIWKSKKNKTIKETDTTHTYFTSKHMVYIKEHNPCMMMIWVNAE